MKTTVTERGQVSIPAELRREMHLAAGQTVVWERVSQTECRIIVVAPAKAKADPVGALNFARERGLETMGSDEWMKLLREGEEE